MEPCFTTDRLDVFKASCERSWEFYSVDVYLAFQRDQGEGVKWPMVVCTMSGGYVEFIESRFSPRRGYALELLQYYTEDGGPLFAKYREAFAAKAKP